MYVRLYHNHFSGMSIEEGDGGFCEVVQCPSDSAALTNLVYIAPGFIDPKVHYVIIDHEYVFSCRTDRNIQKGQIGINGPHRRWASFSLNQRVSVLPYDIYSEGMDIYLGNMKLDIDFFQRSMRLPDEFKEDEIAHAFATNFHSQMFTKGQTFAFEYTGVKFRATVTDLDVVDLSVLKRGEVDAHQEKNTDAIRGLLMRETNVEFNKIENSNLNLKQSKKRAMKAKALIKPDFQFEDLGIGGLDDEFNAIFRRAFASRIFPPALVEKLGVQHVKGLLLYGPPGTGKTLMARQIGKMLNAKEPKVVSGPEVLSKFVGQSEENVRKLFADAEEEYRAKGEESGLHIIILDELDAICKARGSRSGDTGVGDSVVNQLLAKMDGVEQLNNILIIGMTNRKDMIDEALLRPGRLEVHMEIGLPDEKGRLQILKIHTSKMRSNEVLDDDVNLDELADLTKNYSGAEISGVVKAASSYAFSRHIKVGTLAGISADVSDMKVCMDDFLNALKEVQPAFGVSEVELQQCVQNHIIPFSPHIKQILADGKLYVDQVRQSSRTPLVSVLLHGPAGSGKTALAATIAMQSEFPYIKLISPETMVGMTESAKVNEINKIFNDSYKSPISVIVVDGIERLLDYVPIGPRFSNAVLQALLVLLKKKPPKDRRLLILATTTNRGLLEQMDMINEFSAEIYVPTITSLDSVDMVLQQLELFADVERERALSYLRQANMDQKLTIGIKKLLMIIEMARQDEDKVDKFVNTILAL
ncbi:P-loop containing nucleoside triphosphate hydrolase protein [Mycotypha africana]|uniref:P-loop containing nucleoside triphosphate hydrolase protein n=1 Tax=Mycotypha africana TaxID=64632 RepID=UPI0023010E6E|nr:P-loop containing nucleoside triphosphate hydrolase protein [Mycotypha africana]KAI8991630.1 P-loop containing nucleoside triphosphate hydrolase protein [Mycotypha africana]